MIYKKRVKDTVETSKCFGDLHQTVDTNLHLFDNTVKPVSKLRVWLCPCKIDLNPPVTLCY